MRIITLNANGIRAAARKGFFDWMARQAADEFATLWRLREALWSLTQAAVAGEELDPPSVRLVNDLAAGAPPAP